MSEERTRFPITPQERHDTAKSFDNVDAVPEENRPRDETPAAGQAAASGRA